VVIFDGVARLMGAMWLGIPGLAFAAHEKYDRDEGKDVSLTLVCSQLSVNLEFFAFRVLIALR